MRSIENCKKDFPIFSRKINGESLSYLDSTSTTQKPQEVIDAISKYYETMNANIHRGIHTLSEESTLAYEQTRKMVADFISAKPEEIIITSGTTAGINLAAYAWGEENIKEGDEIIVSALEHHANLVPWQQLAKRKGATLKIVPITLDYQFDFNVYSALLSPKTKLVCVTGMSNVIGVMPRLEKIISSAHVVGAKVMIDGAQLVAHRAVNVVEMDCDFLAFSAHKMLGPTGVGFLYVKNETMQQMTPSIFGGDMVSHVSQDSAEFREAPYCFEAGTPNIADVIAFQASLQYLQEMGMDSIAAHDQKILKYAREIFSSYENKGVKLIGPKDISECGGVLSFTIEGVHPHDVAAIFNDECVAVRSGLHCAQPLVESIDPSGTTRMSFYCYTTEEDIDRAEVALKKVLKTFSVKE